VPVKQSCVTPKNTRIQRGPESNGKNSVLRSRTLFVTAWRQRLKDKGGGRPKQQKKKKLTTLNLVRMFPLTLLGPYSDVRIENKTSAEKNGTRYLQRTRRGCVYVTHEIRSFDVLLHHIVHVSIHLCAFTRKHGTIHSFRMYHASVEMLQATCAHGCNGRPLSFLDWSS